MSRYAHKNLANNNSPKTGMLHFEQREKEGNIMYFTATKLFSQKIPAHLA
jgi:hypothetical protein